MPEHFTLHADDILLPAPRPITRDHAPQRQHLAALRAEFHATIAAIDATLTALEDEIARTTGRPR